VIGNPGNVQAIMALYANGAGAPTTLLAQTSSSPIVPGPNVLPLTSVFTTPAVTTTYWLAAEFNANVSVCEDTSSSNPTYHGSFTFGTVPANFASVGSPTGVSSVDYNFYVVAGD
jgi:hypothetical protein